MNGGADNTGGGALKPGERIGKYEVREQLGAGGQSIVYKCYDELLDRFVAVKQVAAHLAQDRRYLEQLRENLRKIARLGAKNEAIVAIHEVIEDPRGLFYVMEFVEGHTLETLIREAGGPIEPKAVLLILFRLAAALHDVHNAGIVHRDMKPGNIIMTGGLRPKIIDFGVAAAVGSDISIPLATTKYLAPELYSRSCTDGRADLYSLGFIAYEMLLGREKFNEIFQDVVRDKHSEALRWMKWHGNEAVSAPTLHEVNPAIPPALSRIIARMIQKDPENRFADTEELGRAIKGSFSPKARRVGGPPTSIRETSDELLAKLSVREGMGSLEGEDLEMSPAAPGGTGETAPRGSWDPEATDLEGPATAPLPRGPMTRTTRIVLVALAAVVFLGLVGGGIVWMTYLRSQTQARAMSATNVYQEATALFNDEKFAPALEKFDYLLKRHRNTIQGRKATVLGPMSRAHLAVQQRQWDQGQLYERDARQAAEALLEKSNDKVLDDWVRKRLQDIEELGKSRFSSNEFFNAMQVARGSLAKATKESDFDRIRRDFEDAVGAGDVVLTASQESQSAAMKDQISRRKFVHLFEGDVNRGEQMLKQRQYDQAEAAFQHAVAMFSGENNLAGLISPGNRQSRRAGVDKKLRELETLRQHDKFHLAISKAEKEKDTAALKKALKEALKLTTLPPVRRKDYEKRLRDLEVGEGLAMAKKYLAEGNFSAARDALRGVLELDPSNVQGRSMLAETEKAAKRAELIQAGDQGMIARDFSAALKQYRQAAQYGSDEALKEKITDCEYTIELQRANDLVKAGKYDQAAAAYQNARQIKPANEAQIEALLLAMKTQREYFRLLTKGDEAMKKNNWQEAIRWYNRAKQTRESQEINDRIDLTYYKKHVIEGKEALGNENWPVARWNFKRALKYKDTPETRALLKQADAEEEIPQEAK